MTASEQTGGLAGRLGEAQDRLRREHEPPAQAPGLWLSPEQAAERTPLSRKAIYGAIRRGELQASKRCGRWMIREQDLEAWIAGGTVDVDERAPQPPARPRRGGGARAPASGSLAALRAIEEEASRA